MVIFVSVDDATGIAGADIVLSYDSHILTAREVRKTDLITSSFLLVPNLSEPGEIRISLASATDLPGGSSGTLVEILFDVSADAKWENSSQLHLSSISLNDILGQPIAISSVSDGMFEVVPTAVEEVGESSLPESFSLSQNFPNPFNTPTVIGYGLPEASNVKLKIYDIVGQKVHTLVDRFIPAGYHTVVWDGKNERGKSVASGVYLYRLEALEGKVVKARRMLLLR